MAVLDFGVASSTSAAPQAGTRAPRPVKPVFPSAAPVAERETATIWLNVGVPGPNGKFINLPVGIPVDTMKFLELRGQNQDWIDFQDQRNMLLEALQAKGDSLEPGQEIVLSGLELRLRKVGNEVAPSTVPQTRASTVAALVAALGGTPPASSTSTEAPKTE